MISEQTQPEGSYSRTVTEAVQAPWEALRIVSEYVETELSSAAEHRSPQKKKKTRNKQAR